MNLSLLFSKLAARFWSFAWPHRSGTQPGTFKRLLPAFLVLLLVSSPPSPVQTASAPLLLPGQGCTAFYATDGQIALAGNNEDFNNPFTLVWFIPASPGKYGRVYFGFDDYIPQGGMNDQGVFFDGLALEYKDMPLTNQRPHYPDGELAWTDLALATSANVQEVTDLFSRWYLPGGEMGQQLFGDRFGSSVIFDGDTVLPLQGAVQVATNFRLVDHPNPPYPEERYGMAYDTLSNAGSLSVELFRQVLDAAHAEGDFPTVYSQVYELNTGIIHLYLHHDFEHEVVLNLADELAKGPHVLSIASLFPENAELEDWSYPRELLWKASYTQKINPQIMPSSLSWMSGEYVVQEEAEAGPVKVYLENDQLYLQKPNQFPIELYPTSSDTVFHHYFNGEDLTLTFQRGRSKQASGAQGAFTFEAYNLYLPYHLTRTSSLSPTTTLLIGIAGMVLLLALLGGILWSVRKRQRSLPAKA